MRRLREDTDGDIPSNDVGELRIRKWAAQELAFITSEIKHT